MAQLVKTAPLTTIKEIIYTSDSDQIVFVKFFNKTMVKQYINADWTNGILHEESIMESSQHPKYFAHSQHELQMKTGDTISAEGSEGMEYEIIA
jgi:cell division protein FtsL